MTAAGTVSVTRASLVHRPAIDAGFTEPVVEHAACRSRKWAAFPIILIAGLFADQHEARSRGAFSEHRLRGVLVQWARHARAGNDA